MLQIVHGICACINVFNQTLNGGMPIHTNMNGWLQYLFNSSIQLTAHGPFHVSLYNQFVAPWRNLLVPLQGDLGLNICEAHAFNTSDRFSLDIFVVDGWKPDGSKESLEQALSSRFAQVAPASQPPREQQPSTVAAAANAVDKRRWVRSPLDFCSSVVCVQAVAGSVCWHMLEIATHSF